MNKEVMGTQQTILFYVDDIKMSHVKESVLLGTVSELKKRYGKISNLSVNRGDIHDFLSLKNKQRDQANTPASMYLFRIDGTSPDLKKGC